MFFHPPYHENHCAFLISFRRPPTANSPTSEQECTDSAPDLRATRKLRRMDVVELQRSSRRNGSGNDRLIKDFFGVCLVSIMREHQRDQREFGWLKRKEAKFDYSRSSADLIDAKELEARTRSFPPSAPNHKDKTSVTIAL